MISVAVAWSISIPVFAVERMRVALGLSGSMPMLIRSKAIVLDLLAFFYGAVKAL
jgi:hypothetical protein